MVVVMAHYIKDFPAEGLEQVGAFGHVCLHRFLGAFLSLLHQRRLIAP